MAETSGLWTTDGAPAGHQVVSYTEALASDMLAITAACSGYQGVAPGYLSELAPSTTGAFNVRIAAGAAMVDGKYYKNTANVDKTLDTPTAGTTRIDRVVVEATWASFDCVITVIKGSESGGDPVAPAYPSTPGNNYAILICQALVNNAGDVTITDERTWAITPTDNTTLEDTGVGSLRVKDGGVTLAKMAANSVDSDQYVDGSIDLIHMSANSVDATKIVNRSRRLFVPAVAGNSTAGDDYERLDIAGWRVIDGALVWLFGEFAVPADYSSAMTVKAVFQPAASGNAYVKNEARYGTSGEAYSIHTADDGGYAAIGVTNLQLSIVQSVSLASAAVGDIVTMTWYRDSSNAADTLSAYVYFKGWLVEYTADS